MAWTSSLDKATMKLGQAVDDAQPHAEAGWSADAGFTREELEYLWKHFRGNTVSVVFNTNRNHVGLDRGTDLDRASQGG